MQTTVIGALTTSISSYVFSPTSSSVVREKLHPHTVFGSKAAENARGTVHK